MSDTLSLSHEEGFDVPTFENRHIRSIGRVGASFVQDVHHCLARVTDEYISAKDTKEDKITYGDVHSIIAKAP